jgi:hypothetical protein
MTQRFDMSMMGKLKFFLGFQVRQLERGTFISQEKYVKDMLACFETTKAKSAKNPIPTKVQLDLGEGEKPVDQKVYRSMDPFSTFVLLGRT